MIVAPKYKTVAAGMIGNVLEWYDFAIYAVPARARGGDRSRDPEMLSRAMMASTGCGYLQGSSCCSSRWIQTH